jgi:hypothetical protein
VSGIRKPGRAEFVDRPAVSGLRETAELVREITEEPRRGFTAALQTSALWLAAPLVIAVGIAGVGRPAGLYDTAVFLLGGLILPLLLSVPLIRRDAARRRARIARIRLDYPE